MSRAKGRPQRFIPTDDAFIALFNERRHKTRNDNMNSHNETQDYSTINMTSDTSPDSKTMQESSPEPFVLDDSSPQNISLIKPYTSSSGKKKEELKGPSLKLHSDKSHEQLQEKLKSIAYGQINFSHTTWSPKKKNSKTLVDDERITKIAYKNNSSFLLPGDANIAMQKRESPIKKLNTNEKDVKNQGKSVRSKSMAKETVTLFSEESDICLFPKVLGQKQKKLLRTPDQKKAIPEKDEISKISETDHLISKLVGMKISARNNLKTLPNYSPSPPKIRPNFVKEYLNRDDTVYKSPLLERLRGKSPQRFRNNSSQGYRVQSNVDSSFLQIKRLNSAKKE